jgi:hypothetical protein
MVPIAPEDAEEWPQGEPENDQNIENPNPIVEDVVEPEDDDPAPEVPNPAVVANAAVVANDDGGAFGEITSCWMYIARAPPSTCLHLYIVIEESPPN